MVNRGWTCVCLFGLSLQVAHAQTGDQFNAGSAEDCYRRVERVLYEA